MKDQAIHYLGLDVHQATIVATCRDESGAIVLRATAPTEAKAIVGLVRGQGPRVHVTFEEGTQAQWLHDLLQPVAERVVVCNVRGKKELVNKNDDIDSDVISERLRLGALKEGVYHGAASVLPLKEMVRNYSQLDALLPLRSKAKAAMIAEARRHPAWKILPSIPFLGPSAMSLASSVLSDPRVLLSSTVSGRRKKSSVPGSIAPSPRQRRARGSARRGSSEDRLCGRRTSPRP